MFQGETFSPPTRIESLLGGEDSHHPEDNTPETNSQGRRKDILAFRTITNFGAAFMLEPPINTDHIPRSSMEKIELDLSSSLASLAVLGNEVIGVVVMEGYRSNAVKAIITYKPRTEEKVPMNGVFPDSDGQKASVSTKPILLSPGVPIQYKKFKKERKRVGINEGDILDSYIREVLHSQGCQSISLDDHIWMLRKILNTRCAQDIKRSLKQLLLYMVIACFRKLSQRTRHVRSKPFLQALTDVDLKGIDFDKAKPKTTTATNGQISIDNGCLAHFLKSRRPGGYEYTRLNAKATISNTTFYDKDTFEEFHYMLLSILETYQSELERMKNATGNDALSKETFKKAASNVLWAGDLLHRLTTGAALPMHLQTIEKSLSGLATPILPKSQGEEAGVYPVQDKVGTPLRDDLTDSLALPFNEGNDSVDEESHNFPQDQYPQDNLHTDHNLDGDHYNASDEDGAGESERTGDGVDPRGHGHAVAGAKANDPDDNTPDDVHDDGDKGDDDFEEIKSDTLKWIKLLVSQFSSAYMLLYGLPDIHISLQMLQIPPVGDDLMPWKELLADSNFFPAGSPIRAGSRLWNNEQIASFLDKGQQSNRRLTRRLAQDAHNTWQRLLKTYQSNTSQSCSVYQPLFDHVVEIMSQMHDQTTVPGCRATARDILRVLHTKTALGVAVANLVDSARTTQVTQHLLYIIDLCYIFGRLATTKFSGSLHCAAALGTLISTPINGTHPQYSSLLAELQQFGPIIGTSKRCCPVCAYLLSIISPTSSSQSFVTRGSHKIITSCTLPDWTPPHVVKQMIDYFGAPLREEIGRLMERTKWSPLKYNPSSGSSAISVTDFVLDSHRQAGTEEFGMPDWT